MGSPIEKPNPQDFITRGAVITPGVSVNPHRGLGYKATENGITPKNIYYQDADGGIPFPLLEPRNDEWGKITEKSTGVNVEDLYEDMPGEDGVRQFKSDAPTYEKREQDTFDKEGYKKLKEEYETQREIREKMMYQLAQIAASNSSTPPSGGGQVNVGSRGPIQINPLNPVAQIKQPDILTGPFLGRWRR